MINYDNDRDETFLEQLFKQFVVIIAVVTFPIWVIPAIICAMVSIIRDANKGRN